MRRSALCLALSALAASVLLAQAPGSHKRTVSDDEVARVHKSARVTHNDVTSADVAGMDIGQPNPDHMTDLRRMKQGGVVERAAAPRR